MLAERGDLEDSDVVLEDDWGIYNDPKDIVFVARTIQQSKWACLPEQGGLNDQPALLMQDVLQYMRLKSYIHAEIDQGDREG